MLNRLLHTLKLRSNVTLRQWSYQCEYIFAQRSRRIQQLLSFYHQFWGEHGFKQLLQNYRTQFSPPLQGLMIGAVGVLSFDWNNERIKLTQFDVCHSDIEFIERIPVTSACDRCKQRAWKLCYCNSSRGKNWEPYVSRDNFSVWRREEKPSLYAYKVYVHYDDVTAVDFLKVQTDTEYRKEWDTTAVNLEIIETDHIPNSNSHLIYWEMQWPKLFANRDYVYCRRIYTDRERNAIIIFNQSTKHPNFPEYPDKVRVNEYWSYMVIKPYTSFQEPGIHYILTYFDDPGLSIPTKIRSWVTQVQIPDFLNRLYHATKLYASQQKEKTLSEQIFARFKIPPPEYAANENRSRMQGRK